MKPILSHMDKIKQASAQLDTDPNYQFTDFNQCRQVMAYRAAGGILRQQERFPKVKPQPRFWRQCKPGVKATRPVNLLDT